MNKWWVWAILLILVVWLGITFFQLRSNVAFRDCHIQLCSDVGLNTTINRFDFFYDYDLPSDFVSCYNSEGGFTTVHMGEDIARLCR